MRLLESRAVRLVLVWVLATLALKALAFLVIRYGVPADMVMDIRMQLAQLQADSWKLVLALVAKWAAEDFAKWMPVAPPERPGTVVQTGDQPVVNNPPAAPGIQKGA